MYVKINLTIKKQQLNNLNLLANNNLLANLIITEIFMYIQHFGHFCFKISTKDNGEDVYLVIDPFNKNTGLKLPNLNAHIILTTIDHPEHNNTSFIKTTKAAKKPFLINGPGEYETGGIFVQGILSNHFTQNTIYLIQTENITITHLGRFFSKQLTGQQLEVIKDSDILIIPVGGYQTIDAKEAVKIISQVEPRIIIPMYYNIPGLKIKEINSVDKFIKEIGIKVEELNKFKITKKDLPQEETKVILLKP